MNANRTTNVVLRVMPSSYDLNWHSSVAVYVGRQKAVNVGLLTAEICWRVWGTPANFSGFCILAALLDGTLVMGVSETAA